MTVNARTPRPLLRRLRGRRRDRHAGTHRSLQTDIVNFACLSGDFNEVHTNFEYCKTTPFGEPIAHGPLVYAIMGGLQYASGINDGTLLALLQIDAWRMLGPVKHGDTIRMQSRGDREEGNQQARPRRGHLRAPMHQAGRHGGAGDEGHADVPAATEKLGQPSVVSLDSSARRLYRYEREIPSSAATRCLLPPNFTIASRMRSPSSLLTASLTELA